MLYQAELTMMREILRKHRIQTLLLDPHAPLDERADLGLRHLLSGTPRQDKSFYDYTGSLRPRTLYTLTDPLHCRYLFLLLPDLPQDTLLLIGPFAADRLSRGQMLEFAEKTGVQPRLIKQLEEYCNSVPLMPEQNQLYAVLDTFAERIWGVGRYTAVDISKEQGSLFHSPEQPPEDTSPETTLWSIRNMERRYDYENELIRAVTNGQVHKAEVLLAGLKDTSFERRLSDRLRDAKNYCIIMNTLLRKAAEAGGVHPIHLDSVSSDLAQRIEQLSSDTAVGKLMEEIFRTYCLLVRDHAVGQYSTLVQQTIAYISTDLSADLSLRTLAATQNVSPSYLSTLFHRETGRTLTDYVNEQRVKSAKQLLRTTNLQVQTIAQHCGVLDVYYFSKIFKKHTGKTPREYRESVK